MRDANKYWHPGSVAIQVNDPNSLTEFNSNGFNLGTDSNNLVNSNLKPYAAVSIRQAEGFLTLLHIQETAHQVEPLSFAE